MENYSNYSYPDSRDSSPRSREIIDCDNASWDEPQPPSSTYKAKFMCSYGGKIQPRPHDNQLAYVGGDTKILAVDRTIKFPAFVAKLSSICDADVCFKYQLPGEDLDALISVTNDEDLDHMMMEYDRLYRASAKPARLRLFLFPLNPPPPSQTSFGSSETKSERQWFVDALNSVQIQSLEGSSPPAAAVAAVSAQNPDFLFGFDKGYSTVPAGKFSDSVPPPTVPDSIVAKDVAVGSDCGSEDRHVVGEPVVSPADIQRQIQELQRLQIANQEQAMLQRKYEEVGNPRAYTGDYYSQKVPEKLVPAPAPAPVPVQVPMQMPATYVSERHVPAGGYHVATGAPPGTEQPVYLIQTPSGMYQAPAMRPVTGHVGQPYYGVQRMVPEVYREPPQVYPQQQKMGTYTDQGIPMMPPPQQQPQPQPQQPPQQPKVGMAEQGYAQVGMAEQGYAQVGYDSAGRQVYYTATATTYQNVTPVAVDGRQVVTSAGAGVGVGVGGQLNQEGKVVVAKASQASAM